ncbi:MAG: tetratricopeptide repeat protein [Chloroflexi bacterium]|nr:tetratricopeptide repeat protein [Chloroflexota bacterium]
MPGESQQAVDRSDALTAMGCAQIASSDRRAAGVLPPVLTAAQAYWNQRDVLASGRERIQGLKNAVGRSVDLGAAEWMQLLAYTLEFAPDLILELGRGYGNSTCVFTEAANRLGAERCRVLSVCLSNDWHERTVTRVREVVPGAWFAPLEALQANILDVELRIRKELAAARRVLIFWDAHGYDVAECILGRFLPLIADRPHVVLVHDMSDARYSSKEYGGQGLWKGHYSDDGPRHYVHIGHIVTLFEEVIPLVDFASRNDLALHSAAHVAGRGVFHLRERDRNVNSLLELATAGGQAAIVAQEYLEAGEPETAIAALEHAREARPLMPVAQYLLGCAELQRGQPQDALGHLRRAVELARHSADAHNALGVALHATGDDAGAEAAFMRALKLDATHADAGSNLAELREAHGRVASERTAVAEACVDQ